MSINPSKPSENSLSDPEASPGAQQKRIKNGWSFNLRKSIPLYRENYPSEKDGQIGKSLVRKFYGKKILFVTKPQEAHAMVSRSKLLNSVEIDESLYISNNLKSKGSLVIFSYYRKSLQKEDELELKKRLLWKKILKNCPKADIKICYERDFRLFKYMLALRHLTLGIEREIELALAGEMVGNFLNLQILKVETWKTLPSKKPKKSLFRSIHKLSRLQKVKWWTDSQFLQDAEIEHEIEMLYNQPLNFDISTTIKVEDKLEIKKETGLMKILNAAEYLSLRDCKDPIGSVSMGKEEKRIMKIDGKKNIVRIYSEKKSANIVPIYSEKKSAKVNIEEILSCCNSLKYLYLKDGRDRSDLPKISEINRASQEGGKGFPNLRMAVLEFQNLEIECDDDAEEDKKISQFAIFHQIKEKCPSLQTFSLYLSNFKLIDDSREYLIQFIQEVSTFNKLKALGLGLYIDDLKKFSLSDLLSSNSIESFQLKLDRSWYSSYVEWDKCFATAKKSEIKNFKITIPAEAKLSLFGINLLSYIPKLENLQVIELIDKSLEVITFDFFYGFVQSLLTKKNIRKIVICTKAVNNFYSEKFGIVLSKTVVGAQLKGLLDTISQELKDLVNILKAAQLEEIFIGKLQGYSFDYLFYNKEMGVPEKLFWTQEELDNLFCENKQLASRYEEIFNVFKPKRET